MAHKNGKAKGAPGKARAADTKRLPKRIYNEELIRLQAELVKLQEWVRAERARVVVIFEGRDAAGKGSTIKRVNQYLNPRIARIAALPAPTERERSQWYFGPVPLDDPLEERPQRPQPVAMGVDRQGAIGAALAGQPDLEVLDGDGQLRCRLLDLRPLGGSPGTFRLAVRDEGVGGNRAPLPVTSWAAIMAVTSSWSASMSAAARRFARPASRWSGVLADSGIPTVRIPLVDASPRASPRPLVDALSSSYVADVAGRRLDSPWMLWRRPSPQRPVWPCKGTPDDGRNMRQTGSLVHSP